MWGGSSDFACIKYNFSVLGWPLTRQLTRALLRLNSPLRGCSALRRQNLVLPLLSSLFRPAFEGGGTGFWWGRPLPRQHGQTHRQIDRDRYKHILGSKQAGRRFAGVLSTCSCVRRPTTIVRPSISLAVYLYRSTLYAYGDVICDF